MSNSVTNLILFNHNLQNGHNKQLPCNHYADKKYWQLADLASQLFVMLEKDRHKQQMQAALHDDKKIDRRKKPF
jgi:hypothetical protein